MGRDGSVKRLRFAALPFESDVTLATPFHPVAPNEDVSAKPISADGHRSATTAKLRF